MSGTVTRLRKVMTYSEFVWFILSEEDKSTLTAAEFWFRVMDRDGDGIITLEGMCFTRLWLEQKITKRTHKQQILNFSTKNKRRGSVDWALSRYRSAICFVWSLISSALATRSQSHWAIWRIASCSTFSTTRFSMRKSIWIGKEFSEDKKTVFHCENRLVNNVSPLTAIKSGTGVAGQVRSTHCWWRRRSDKYGTLN